MQDDSFAEQSSYVMEHSIGTDMEFSTINRLLADFNINRDSSVTQRRSPLKSLKITGDSLNAGNSAATHDVTTPRETQRMILNSHELPALKQSKLISNHFSFISVAEMPPSTAINADDTVEEVEYVLDLGLNYVPKRLINEIKMKSEAVKQELKTEGVDDADDGACKNAGASNDDDEVILVESSPENSFTTTMTTGGYKTAVESVENTFYTAKSILNNVSVVSIDSDESDEQPSNSESTTEQSTQDTIEQSLPSQEPEQEKSSSILQKTDISAVDSMEISTSTQIDNSAMTDMEMPNFNDSLERVEYMMEQAQKMMNIKTKLCAPLCQTEAKKTPVSQTKLKPKVLTPNSATLKKAAPKHLTPNKCDPFKRPDQRNARSPFTAKAASASKVQPAPTHGQSRIPTKIPGSLHKPQFRHIASPIAAYIKNTPEVPLLKTIKPMRNLLTEDFNKACKSNSSLDESTQSVESLPTKSALPRKMYISAQQRKVNTFHSFSITLIFYIYFHSIRRFFFLLCNQVIDHRYVITPGGKSVQKLIGNQPLVIRHDGKIKSHNSPARIVLPQFEESLSDLSMVSGDISVQVVQDVHRLN